MPTIEEYESQFRRAGLPFFIEDYSATRDVFPRTAPFLTIVFLGEMLGAIKLDWSLLANIGAALGGLVILLVTWAVANTARGRRVWALPRTVGRVELAVFVLVPALLPLIFGGQWESALVTAAVNLGLLALVYLVGGYGAVAIRLVGELGASAVRLARVLPLILGGAVLLFLTTELWQVFADMPLRNLFLIAGFFAAIGTGFLAARLPNEVSRLESGGPPLSRGQRLNVGLVLFFSQAIQVLTVALGVAAFFVVLGALAVGPHVQQEWIGTSGNLIVDVPVLGRITEELLRVAGGLAALSGLSYAVQMQTDDTYRRLFLDEVVGGMQESFNARADYIRARYS
jgi:hypothetical protein